MDYVLPHPVLTQYIRRWSEYLHYPYPEFSHFILNAYRFNFLTELRRLLIIITKVSLMNERVCRQSVACFWGTISQNTQMIGEMSQGYNIVLADFNLNCSSL